ncbi:MAG: hypothetical protein BMS9Abin23_1124 [Thermodesulfobacteriota bacterium]|nr:MAG: hypothetical protein BMS9Abin23_1124 [Thermodesulfobacteriota bacterium]
MSRNLTAAALLIAGGLLIAVPAAAVTGLGDITISNQSESRKDAGVGPVIYPHTRHEKIFKCEVCHPKIFVKKRGANKINMKLNMNGKYCGAPGCHNSLKAFPLYECFKCHQGKG